MKTPSINIHREMLSKIEEALGKEWIITNGLGGYASSTILGLNTRKYHGLLVAAFHPPRDRRLCLAKLDEELIIGNNFYPLFSNEFQSGIFPKGHMFLKRFSLSPFPKYVYAVENVEVQKTLFMPYKKNAVIAMYEVFKKDSSEVKMRVSPLITCRHFHSVVDRWRNPLNLTQKPHEKRVMVNVDAPRSTLVMEATEGLYFSMEKWVEKVYFREEFSRGESSLDDWYQLGFFEINIDGKHGKFAITAFVDEDEDQAIKISSEMPATTYDSEALYDKTVERCESFLVNFYNAHDTVKVENWLSWIVLAADAFIVEGAEKPLKSVIAGYHWFEDWGRDTFVSLPGLMLVTGRFEDARQTFLTFKKYRGDGCLIPNLISDQDAKPVYNSVDATLWYVNAVLQYLKYTGDLKFVETNLWEDLKTMVESLIKGTAFNIHVDGDGLLSHGPQLTWMDTVVDNQPLTPRAGKAVEVQALWYNALKTLEVLARKFKEESEAENFARLAENAKGSFNEKFWNTDKGCLFDVVDVHGHGDASLRPNQIIAAALDFTMLNDLKSEKIVDLVCKELLTPYGLRTLARGDPQYVGLYFGDRRNRDKAYHNGTVWPWLLGPFTTAFLKTKGYADFRREYALKNFLLPLFTEQIFKAGLGTISEIFDGDPPYNPRGCIAQAWSVAEPLRAYVEDVMQVRPKHEREILSALG
ncbi:MAG: amylo-alpha-1,6-glucosidase [Candidatus Bathyarchaeales archaeon]